MTSNETIKKLENYLHTATTPENDDIDITALDGFCTTIQLETNASFAATKVLLPKIQSANTTEALNALSVLEECMAKCGAKFQTEVGKFRFLNGLIELISKKHRGNSTPKIVRDKILDLLLIWTVQYSHETKIKEAYETLRKQGEIHEPPQNVIVQPRNANTASGVGVQPPQNIIMQYPKPVEDEISRRLKKLLQSKDPLDVKAANLIIQNMVREDEKKIQMKSLRLLELKKVGENVSVLEEMLEQYNPNETTEDELSTIKDLYRACEKLHPTVLRLAQETQESEESLGDILEASDRLTQVFEKYKEIIVASESNNRTTKSVGHGSSASNELFDLFDVTPSGTTAAANVDTKILPSVNEMQLDDVGLSTSVDKPAPEDNLDSMKELNDVFAQINKQNLVVASSEILQPQQVASNLSIKNNDKYDLNFDGSNWLNENTTKTKSSSVDPQSNIGTKTTDDSSIKSYNLQTNSASNKNIPDLDSLVTGMLHSSLNKQQPSKDDEKSSTSVHDNEDEIMLDCLGSDEPPKSEKSDTLVVTPQEEKVFNNGVSNPINLEDGKSQQKLVSKEFKSLADIEIDLDKINPSKEPPRIIMNDTNGLKIVLNFAEDHPRPDVSVIVVTIVNQDVEPISTFQLDASVTKSCKLRLLKPSGNQLPGVKPFRPPVENITQVLLFSNPKKIKTVNMVCILSYCVGDDPDPIRESIEVKDLPYLLDDNDD